LILKCTEAKKEHGVLHCQPLWSHVLVPLLCSKLLIKSAPGQEKLLSGSIVDVLAGGSQRKQKNKTACCGVNLLCFNRSNKRVCFASLQESRSGWFGATPWRTSKYWMGAHILNILNNETKRHSSTHFSFYVSESHSTLSFNYHENKLQYPLERRTHGTASRSRCDSE
jgi:hypothetical protein